MHEVSIAQGIIATLTAQAEEHDFARVKSLTVEAGEMTGVVPDSLVFAWEMVSQGTVAEGSRLDLRKLPIRCECRDCGSKYEVAAAAYTCPACASDRFSLLSGKELRIVELEVEGRKNSRRKLEHPDHHGDPGR